MHYYQFNIGDYASHTSRLKPLEDLAYRRMLDLYYLSEQPLNGFVEDIAREIGLSEYVNEVEYVLGKFFTQEVDTFSQKRIDLEIKKYKSNAKNKSKAGKASAKARQAKTSSKVTGVEQTLNTNSTHEQLNINHKPITNNHKPITNKQVNKDIVTSVPKFNFKKELLALNVDDKVLSDWMDVRKKKKATNSETAFNGLLTEIEKSGLSVADAIKVAAENSWSGFKSQWYSNLSPTQKAKSTHTFETQNYTSGKF